MRYCHGINNSGTAVTCMYFEVNLVVEFDVE